MDASSTPLRSVEELAAEIDQLKALLVNQSLVSNDPNVTIRHPSAQFRPSIDAIEAFPSLAPGYNFFRERLDDDAKWRFLHDCPKNASRDVEPPGPSARIPSATPAHRAFDAQLRDIQSRLIGLMRPLDWYAYQSCHAQWSADQWRTHSQSLVRNVMAMLADHASYITDLRVDSVRASIPGLEDAKIRTGKSVEPLMDIEALLDEVKLARSLREAAQPPKQAASGKKRKNRNPRVQAPPAAAHPGPGSSSATESSSTGFAQPANKQQQPRQPNGKARQ